MSLRGCINDIRNINSILQQHFRYDAGNIRVLTEETAIPPTRGNIEANVQWLVGGSQPGDTLLFYYSGHGAQVKDTSGEEADGMDEIIIPLDVDSAGCITDDWLYARLAAAVPEGVTLFGFADCCHSGTLMDLTYNWQSKCVRKKTSAAAAFQPNDWTSQYQMEIDNTKETKGRVVMFSGSLDSQTSADARIRGQFQGAFTYCLIEYIKRLVHGGKGSRRLLDVLKDINIRLRSLGFTDQTTQLSVGRLDDVNTEFGL